MRALLLLAFILIPITELWVILGVSDSIGLGWTIVALFVVSVVGAALVKSEGLKAWQRFRLALTEGRLPTAEVTDGALLLLGGALMVTPGFLTDAVGLLLVFPVSRSLLNRGLRGRVRGSLGLGGSTRRSREGPRGPRMSRPGTADGEAVDVEVVRIERDEPGEGGPVGELGRDEGHGT